MVTSPSTVTALETGQPHSGEHGSVKAELIAHALHGDALYHDINITVYYKLEEAIHSKQYAASIKPFQYHKDGGGASQVWRRMVKVL